MQQLHFSFNCGTGPAILNSSATYNDNVWHTVAFNRDRQNGTLVVDGEVVAEGMSPGNTQVISKFLCSVQLLLLVDKLPTLVKLVPKKNLKILWKA